MTTIDQQIAEYISTNLNGEWALGNFVLCVIALVLASILCGIVGLERELRGRNAGLRTHLLVGIGSCLVMIVSIYGFPQIPGLNRDIARLAAQVVTGVGFLGAGAIIHKRSGAKGLTTAATIWLVMAIGLACGSMNFILASGTTLLVMVILITFRRFEHRIIKKNPTIIMITDGKSPTIGKILSIAEKCKASIHDLHTELEDDDEIETTFTVVGKDNELDLMKFVSLLEAIEGTRNVMVQNSHKM